MHFGSKLEELNLTRDEINRFGESLKDEKFRELLTEYAAEISDPENRRRYEEEITQLEKDRGMNVQFIHPEAHHVLKTRSARGEIFINICCNPRIDEPSCEAARDRDGKPGHNWRLPFSLTPGRTDRDSAGNSCEIYDVVFHPDALHMAAKNARFMKLIHSTALGGIEDSFHVKLHRDNVKQLKMRYKGVAHPAVIRKPIPGHDQKNRSTGEDMLSFPYPDQNQTEPEPKASHSPLDPDDTRSKQPIKPHYTLKYRSVVDLQDYRCSRDSGPGARPREIVVIIDVPLLRSAQDAEVNVTERRLVLEAPDPAYRLELPLAYPVDEDRGDAKFNKTTKQLTITLPVRPAKTTELQQIICNETKSNISDEAEQEPKEGGLNPDHTEGGLDPDHTEGGLNPDNTEGGLDPDHTEGGLDLDHTEGGLDPDHTEEGFDPDLTEGGLDPDHTEGGLEPDHTEGGLDPDHTEGGLDPDNTEGGLDPDLTEGGLDPDHTEGGLEPDHTEGGLDPDHTEGGLEPDHTEGGLEPDHTEGGLDPDHTEGGLEPDHTEGGLDPDHTEGGLDPDHTEGGLDPDHTEEGFDPDLTEGGLDPDHTEGGLDPDHTEGGLDPDLTEGGLDPDHTESERSQQTDAVQCSRFYQASEPQTHEMSNDLIISPTEPEPDRSVEVVPNTEDEMNIHPADDSSSDTQEKSEQLMEEPVLRETDPDGSHMTLCFQNSLRFELD